MSADWDRVRTIADAVLYEGYLLYPYRATSGKNQSRWQFGVLGPRQADERGIGEDGAMSAQVLLDPGPDAALTIVVRCLQLQRRTAEREVNGGFEAVDQLTVGAQSWLTWDEAVECELSFGPFGEADLAAPRTLPITFAGGRDVEIGRRRPPDTQPAGTPRRADGGRRARRRTAASQSCCTQYRESARGQGRGNRRVTDRDTPDRPGGRRRVRVTPGAARFRRRGGRPLQSVTGASRCWPAAPAKRTSCSFRR